MWGGSSSTGMAIPGAPPPPYGGQPPSMPPLASQTSGAATKEKNDIFVGNLAFNTTEEQLHVAFSEIGRVLNVRMVTDLDTGKPRGFAFVEFEDPQAALSAIRNMNDYELNGRRLRVNFSNSSHLEALAGKLGMDLSQPTQRSGGGAGGGGGGGAGAGSAGNKAPPNAAGVGTSVVADALKGFSKAEAYDVIAKLKETAERDPDEARRLISGHPQLPEALLFLMSNKLDMVKTPMASQDATAGGAAPLAPATATRAADPRARADPRMAAAAPAAPPVRTDPRQQAARMDPRIKQEATAPPPPMPPPPPPPPPQGGFVNHAPHLDPTLVQQVMSLTPQQIQQLPPDKQQSILQLRQQITGGAH